MHIVLLQHVDALGGGGLVVASHVVVHLREALLHVVLGAALPHRPKPEAQRGVVQLRRWERTGGGVQCGGRVLCILAPNSPWGRGDLESDNPSQIVPLFAH